MKRSDETRGNSPLAWSEFTDDDLVAEYKARRTGAAYETLVKRHQLGLFRFLQHSVADSCLADELCVATFVRAAQRIDSCDRAFEDWLMELARAAL